MNNGYKKVKEPKNFSCVTKNLSCVTTRCPEEKIDAYHMRFWLACASGASDYLFEKIVCSRGKE